MCKPYTLDRNLLVRAWRDGVHDAECNEGPIDGYHVSTLDTELAALWREAFDAYLVGYRHTKLCLNNMKDGQQPHA